MTHIIRTDNNMKTFHIRKNSSRSSSSLRVKLLRKGIRRIMAFNCDNVRKNIISYLDSFLEVGASLVNQTNHEVLKLSNIEVEEIRLILRQMKEEIQEKVANADLPNSPESSDGSSGDEAMVRDSNSVSATLNVDLLSEAELGQILDGDITFKNFRLLTQHINAVLIQFNVPLIEEKSKKLMCRHLASLLKIPISMREQWGL